MEKRFAQMTGMHPRHTGRSHMDPVSNCGGLTPREAKERLEDEAEDGVRQLKHLRGFR